MTGVIGKGAAFAFSRPWVTPMPRRPCRHGGLAGGVHLDADLKARLIEIGIDVARRLGLKGLVSFDLILVDGVPNLVEVNPRPGAGLDVFDDEDGTLFKAHLQAASGEDPTPLLAKNWRPRPRASACLYADSGPLTIGDVSSARMGKRSPDKLIATGTIPSPRSTPRLNQPAKRRLMTTERLGRVGCMYGAAKAGNTR